MSAKNSDGTPLSAGWPNDTAKESEKKTVKTSQGSVKESGKNVKVLSQEPAKNLQNKPASLEKITPKVAKN